MVENPADAAAPPLSPVGAALHRPLIVLAVCAVGAIGYFARDFLIPTAAAVVLALLLTPVANTLERARIPGTAAAALSVVLLALLIAGLLSLTIPSVAEWVQEAPRLTYRLERKLDSVRRSLAFLQELTSRVEDAAGVTASKATEPVEKVVMRGNSLLQQLASTTPFVVIQIAYAGVLSFMLLSSRNMHRRQILRIPGRFSTRVRLARVMRDINERVGYYLFALAAIYAGVAVLATIALALLGLPNAVMWGVAMGFASFVPFVGPPVLIAVVTVVALLTFSDWQRIAAVPALLTTIHFVESQLVTPTFVSRRCALNTVAVFATIGLLGWMWGAIGAIVAVPLLILLSTISAHIPAMHWLEVLLADDRPAGPRRSAKPPLSAPPWRPPLPPVRPARRRADQRRRLDATKERAAPRSA